MFALKNKVTRALSFHIGEDGEQIPHEHKVTDEEAELADMDKQQFRLAFGATIVYIIFGTGMYMWLADMTFVNSLYFIIVTLTTIGK